MVYASLIPVLLHTLLLHFKALFISHIVIEYKTTRKTLSAIINGKQGVTPEMAIKLAAA